MEVFVTPLTRCVICQNPVVLEGILVADDDGHVGLACTWHKNSIGLSVDVPDPHDHPHGHDDLNRY